MKRFQNLGIVKNIADYDEEKIKYFTDQAIKRKLDHRNATKFVAYKTKQWLEKFHPEAPIEFA